MPRSRNRHAATDQQHEAPPPRGELVRLQKVLAEAGIASRRHAEEFILTGRVQVDNQVVRELGLKVNPWTQKIHVDGELIRRQKRVYFAVNKPPGVLSTNDDPRGRPRVIDLLPELKERFYPVGRLDEASQGIMLVTNDGELAQQLLHPKYGVPKIYRVQVAGSPSPEQLRSLKTGHEFSDGTFRADQVKWLKQQGDSTFLEIVLREGHNREVRRLLARIGHKVVWLQRIAFGPLRLGKMAPGEFRTLTNAEVEELRHAAENQGERPRPRPGSRAKRPAGPRSGRNPTTAKPAFSRSTEQKPRRKISSPAKSSSPANAPARTKKSTTGRSTTSKPATGKFAPKKPATGPARRKPRP